MRAAGGAGVGRPLLVGCLPARLVAGEVWTVGPRASSQELGRVVIVTSTGPWNRTRGPTPPSTGELRRLGADWRAASCLSDERVADSAVK